MEGDTKRERERERVDEEDEALRTDQDCYWVEGCRE